MKKFYLLLLACCACLTFTACDDLIDGDGVFTDLSSEKLSYTFTSTDAQEFTFGFTSSEDWSANESDFPSWFGADPTSGLAGEAATVTITVGENLDSEDRSFELIILASSGESLNITVAQSYTSSSTSSTKLVNSIYCNYGDDDDGGEIYFGYDDDKLMVFGSEYAVFNLDYSQTNHITIDYEAYSSEKSEEYEMTFDIDLNAAGYYTSLSYATTGNSNSDSVMENSQETVYTVYYDALNIETPQYDANNYLTKLTSTESHSNITGDTDNITPNEDKYVYELTWSGGNMTSLVVERYDSSDDYTQVQQTNTYSFEYSSQENLANIDILSLTGTSPEIGMGCAQWLKIDGVGSKNLISKITRTSSAWEGSELTTIECTCIDAGYPTSISVTEYEIDGENNSEIDRVYSFDVIYTN